jgi:hypothetical protein
MQYPDMDIQVRDKVNPVIKDSWIFSTRTDQYLNISRNLKRPVIIIPMEAGIPLTGYE